MPKATKRAPRERTPKAVIDAFMPEGRKVGDIPLNPMDMGHFLALERIESRVLDDLPHATAEDAARAVLLLTMPGDEAMALVGEQEAFEARLREFARRVDAAEVQVLAQRLGETLQAAFATVVPGKEASEESPLTGSPPSRSGSGGS